MGTTAKLLDLKVTEKKGHSSGDQTVASHRVDAGKINPDYLGEAECQLKDLWAQYVSCTEKGGLNEVARSLRKRYFSLYRDYRRAKKWRNAINSN